MMIGQVAPFINSYSKRTRIIFGVVRERVADFEVSEAKSGLDDGFFFSSIICQIEMSHLQYKLRNTLAFRLIFNELEDAYMEIRVE
jgi:hypothetical protein